MTNGSYWAARRPPGGKMPDASAIDHNLFFGFGWRINGRSDNRYCETFPSRIPLGARSGPAAGSTRPRTGRVGRTGYSSGSSGGRVGAGGRVTRRGKRHRAGVDTPRTSSAMSACHGVGRFPAGGVGASGESRPRRGEPPVPPGPNHGRLRSVAGAELRWIRIPPLPDGSGSGSRSRTFRRLARAGLAGRGSCRARPRTFPRPREPGGIEEARCTNPTGGGPDRWSEGWGGFSQGRTGGSCAPRTPYPCCWLMTVSMVSAEATTMLASGSVSGRCS